MFRIAIAGLALIASLTSCATTSTSDRPSSPEMEALEPLMGHWRGTAEITSVSEAMIEVMPDFMKPDADGNYPKMGGRNSTRFGLNGTVMIQEGWHEMGEGNEDHYLQITMWDGSAGHYRSWYFSDSGEVGTSTMTFDSVRRMFTVEAEGTRPDGSSYKGSGTMTIIDDDTQMWTWGEESDLGRMEMEGMNSRA